MSTSTGQATQRRIVIGAVILFAVLVGAALAIYSWSASRPASPQLTNHSSLSIHELKQLNPTSGSYSTEGYVAKIYVCPPCPAGAICKPCLQDSNIVISEQKETLEQAALTDTEMLIFVSHPEQFTLGAKYTYVVQVTGAHTTGDSLNDVQLVSHSP
jgi:hypothetical protein